MCVQLAAHHSTRDSSSTTEHDHSRLHLQESKLPCCVTIFGGTWLSAAVAGSPAVFVAAVDRCGGCAGEGGGLGRRVSSLEALVSLFRGGSPGSIISEGSALAPKMQRPPDADIAALDMCHCGRHGLGPSVPKQAEHLSLVSFLACMPRNTFPDEHFHLHRPVFPVALYMLITWT